MAQVERGVARELVVGRPLPTKAEVVAKLSRVQEAISDLNTRLIDVEQFLARLALPTLPTLPTLPEYFPRGSRWVLELYPDEVTAWREALRTIPLEPLTQRERSFVRSMDYYITSERKVTLPQLAWLSVIAGRVGGTVPEIPLRQAQSSSGHANPDRQCRLCGQHVTRIFKECPVCGAPVEEEVKRRG